MDLYTFYAMAAVSLFGLAFGSFLNVCIYRLPRGLSVVKPRSACPKCGSEIAAYDNIPVLSWVFLRGRCRRCGTPITPRYAIVELTTALLFLACFVVFQPFIGLVIKFCIFSFLTLGLIFTDCENRLLPDKLTLTGALVGLALSVLPAFSPQLLDMFVGGPFSPSAHGAELLTAFDWGWRSFANSLLGALVGAGFIWGVGELYFRLRGMVGMGFGDVKLMAMIGAFLGVWSVLLTIFLGSVIGAVLGIAQFPLLWRKRVSSPSMMRRYPDKKERRREAYESAMRCLRLPFGTFLGIAALVTVFFGDAILRWYLGRF
ncbi:MAG TPA: prepilin peptidase [Clostridia bacterium]|nr:prepilin peptidase [Clostridia bacterium]